MSIFLTELVFTSNAKVCGNHQLDDIKTNILKISCRCFSGLTTICVKKMKKTISHFCSQLRFFHLINGFLCEKRFLGLLAETAFFHFKVGNIIECSASFPCDCIFSLCIVS